MSTPSATNTPIGKIHDNQAPKALPIWEGREFAATSLKTFSKLGGNKTTKKQLEDRTAQTTKPQETPDKKTKKAQEKETKQIINTIKNLSAESNNTQFINPLPQDTQNRLTNALKKKSSNLTQEQALGIIDGALRSNKAPKRDLLKLLFQVAQEGDAPIEVAQYIEHMLSYGDATETDGPNFGWPQEIKKQALEVLSQQVLTDDIKNAFYDQSKTTESNKQSATNQIQPATLKDEPNPTPETLSLLRGIINASSFIKNPESTNNLTDLAFNLLVGAANKAITTDTTKNVKTTEEKIPNWLSEVMRGIKPEAFQKIATHVITNQPSYQVDIITTLALAALPEPKLVQLANGRTIINDMNINESCMPFTALSGLLAIENKQDDKLNGPNIVANIGQAFINADCNYKVDGESKWTNSRTTAFLKALNNAGTAQTIEPEEQQKIQDLQQKIQDLAKDALRTCRQGLTSNAYKFDVAIQHIADEACEKPDAASATDSNTTTPKPIISFLAECFVSANDTQKNPFKQSMQDFKTDTGETLFQFKPATCAALRNAMIMSDARKKYVNKEKDFDQWYSENETQIKEHLNSNEEGSSKNIDEINFDRTAFNTMVGNFSEIQEKRYDTLSDDKIVDKMQEILNAAADGTLEIELTKQTHDETKQNLFPNTYMLRQVCTLLNDQNKLNQLLTNINSLKKPENKITILNKEKAETALKAILTYYCQYTEFDNVKTALNAGNIQDATDKFINTLRECDKNIEAIQQEIIKIQKIHEEQLQQALQLFTNTRTLTATSETGNNCLFDAINQQKQSEEDKQYEVDTLRQKYVEIQKAGKDISPEEEQRLQKEQADISCLPQMATHLNRPIVVLTEKSDDGQGENGIQIALPGNNQKGHIIIISLDSVEKNFKEEIGQATFTNAQQEIATALGAKNNQNLEEMTVQDALKQLLDNKNTIALHFKGDTNGGHYQSFVPKQEEKEDFGGFGDLF